jgi:hypothetical protein
MIINISGAVTGATAKLIFPGTIILPVNTQNNIGFLETHVFPLIFTVSSVQSAKKLIRDGLL